MASPVFVLITLILTSAVELPPTTASKSSEADYIRRSCGVTLYPGVCYSSLKPYAAAVHHDPVALAVAAANVSLAKICDASLRASKLRPRAAGRVAAALRDCVDSLRTAAEQTQQSTAEILKLGPSARAGGPGVAWGVSNAQTWMSAALTNEDTCLDGFDGISAAKAAAATDVCNRL
ncbi:hypothetical protein HPP92_010729 [Vanilla planifolia]|uniref:Pectinesterase inhibitor domain-containing protein n=1 Tax=Vanilla planifolia TaxID=51239 RepID=A0A835QZM2_VANPL|nr:hypothetical protein HPP92_010729 [Vanilla planifolia]